MKRSIAYSVRSLLSVICEKPEEMTDEQRISASKAAQQLLGLAWSSSPRDRWLVIGALQSVCRTSEGDPASSVSLLRRCLDAEHMRQYAYEEVPWLARETKRLVSVDPQFVEDVYRAAFCHREESQDLTAIVDSRILGMTSNRRQDFQMSHHALAEIYPDFLARAVQHSTRALISVLEAYVAHKHQGASEDTREADFLFRNRQALIRTDYSAIWDEREYRIDEPLKMLDAFDSRLSQLAKSEAGLPDLREILEIIATGNKLAVLWRHLLIVGARFVKTLGYEIRSLAWSAPILTALDTTTPAGDFLTAVFPLLDANEREQVERAIMAIPEAFPPERQEASEKIRDRLLGCLNVAEMVTEAARRVLVGLHAANAVPPNEPPVRFESFSGPFTEEDWLAEQGVPVQEEPNRQIRELKAPVAAFGHEHMNSTPSWDQVNAILPALRALREALQRADETGVHPKQQESAWTDLAAACACIAKINDLPKSQEVANFVKMVLLDASNHPEPAPDPQYDAQFDSGPSWSPAPRIKAAEGLPMLAARPNSSTDDILQAVERLSRDPVPAVRFQIIVCLLDLYQSARDLMWRIIERLCQEEQSAGVLSGLLNQVLGPLASSYPDRVPALIKSIRDRVREGPAKGVQDSCIQIFTGLYVWSNHALARQIVFQVATDPASQADQAGLILVNLRNTITHGLASAPNPEQDAIRERSQGLMREILQAARSRFTELITRAQEESSDTWPETDREKLRSVASLVDDVAQQIYFASGAFQERTRDKFEHQERSLNRLEKEHFYTDMRPFFDDLAEVGLASTAHYLLETLESLIPVDPSAVFLQIGRVLRAGTKGAYQFESLAVDLFVRVVERYLAEYRDIFQRNAECRRTLLEALDIFVEAGWPSARRLTYRLDEVFR